MYRNRIFWNGGPESLLKKYLLLVIVNVHTGVGLLGPTVSQ